MGPKLLCTWVLYLLDTHSTDAPYFNKTTCTTDLLGILVTEFIKFLCDVRSKSLPRGNIKANEYINGVMLVSG